MSFLNNTRDKEAACTLRLNEQRGSEFAVPAGVVDLQPSNHIQTGKRELTAAIRASAGAVPATQAHLLSRLTFTLSTPAT